MQLPASCHMLLLLLHTATQVSLRKTSDAAFRHNLRCGVFKKKGRKKKKDQCESDGDSDGNKDGDGHGDGRSNSNAKDPVNRRGLNFIKCIIDITCTRI